MNEAIVVASIVGFFGVVNIIISKLLDSKLTGIHKQINSRMDEFLKVNKDLGYAEGKVEGKAEEKEKEKAKNI